MGNLIARIAPNSDLSVDLWPPPPDFDVETDVPDLTGKVAIVTGSNSGIGYHVALRLLRKKARVYVAVRDGEKTRRALTRLEDATFGDIHFLELDLNDLGSVKRAAERFLSKEQRLDILVNNGGIMHPPAKQLTAQSLDASFGTNVASHYLFTKLLLPALSASHAATNTPSRVIFCASSTHTRAPGVQFESLTGGPKRDAWVAAQWSFFVGWILYAQSKLIGIILTNHLAKTHSDVLVATSVHPGSINSELKRNFSFAFQLLWHLALYGPARGALPLLWAATIAKPSEITGQYIVSPSRHGVPSPLTQDEKLEAQVVEFVDGIVRDYL